MASEEKEIEHVRTSELRRGKRPIDRDTQRQRMILKRKFLEALYSGDKAAFIEMLIRDLGQQPGTPAYDQSLRAWSEYHGHAS